MAFSLNRRWLVVPPLAIISQVCMAHTFRLVSQVKNDSAYPIEFSDNDEGEDHKKAFWNGDKDIWTGVTWGLKHTVAAGDTARIHGFRIPWDNQPAEKVFQVKVWIGPSSSVDTTTGNMSMNAGYYSTHQLREKHYEYITDTFNYRENNQEKVKTVTLEPNTGSDTRWYTLYVSKSGDVSLLLGSEQ